MATLTERLAEAEEAYHQLQLGKAAAEFRDSNGETVRFTAANVARLRAYIADLKQQIADEAAGATPCEGPMRSFFV